ncbi:hypothetical protein DsansV1_C27g0198021 [Dioscorea sansibarensis]
MKKTSAGFSQRISASCCNLLMSKPANCIVFTPNDLFGSLKQQPRHSWSKSAVCKHQTRSKSIKKKESMRRREEDDKKKHPKMPFIPLQSIQQRQRQRNTSHTSIEISSAQWEAVSRREIFIKL